MVRNLNTLSKVSQTEKDKYDAAYYLYVESLKKKMTQVNLVTNQKQIHIEN